VKLTGTFSHETRNFKLPLIYAFEIHKQAKTNDTMSRRFDDLMTPLSRNEQMRASSKEVRPVDLQK